MSLPRSFAAGLQTLYAKTLRRKEAIFFFSTIGTGWRRRYYQPVETNATPTGDETMTTTTTRKLTAANTPALARVKAYVNVPTYREVMSLFNARGEAAARAYFGHIFNDTARESCLARIFDGQTD